MGEHKHNPTAISAKNGEIKPKKKKISKRQQENLLRSYMIDKLGIAPILTAMGVDKEVYK